MIINHLRLKDFKNFRGENLLDLRTSDEKGSKKNIVLIGGLNGAGKTSLLEAIRLCLYGKRCMGYVMADSKYKELVASKVNKSAKKEGELSCFVELDLTLDEQSPPLRISIFREWTVQDGKITDERLRLTNEGKELEIIPEEMWEDYILRTIPLTVSDFFFFDGERIKRLASGEDSDRILHDAIHNLFNLGRYEDLENDLAGMVRRIRRRNVGSQKVRDSLMERERVLSTLETDLSETRQQSRQKSSRKEEIIQSLSRLEQDLRRKAGKYATMRDRLEQDRIHIERAKAENETELREVCTKYLPFLMATEVTRPLVSQLRMERRIKENAIAAAFLEDVDEKLGGRLSKSSKLRECLSVNEIQEVVKETRDIMTQIRGELNSASAPVIHDLSETESRRIELFLDEMQTDARSKLERVLEDRQEQDLQLRGIAAKLRSVPEGVVESQISGMAELRSEIHVIGNEISALYEKRDGLETQIGKTRAAIEETEEKIVCIEDDERKIETAKRTIAVIQKLRSLLVSRKSIDLEDRISQAHSELGHKRDMVSRIRIDPDSFSAVLLDPTDQQITRESISAGEQEIYAISVLWGLAGASGFKMPMIIDAPLAKLDSNHARNMTTRFFPSASHQVVLLSQDREIDRELFDKLQPYIARTYLLSLEEENKVKEGYFFD